jgi:hypothetical protein
MRTITKTEMLDGFDSEPEAADDQDANGARRVIQGDKLKFSNDFVWVSGSDEEEVSPETELIVAERTRVLQKWGKEGAPTETRFLEPQEPWPNLKALNEKVPKSEWREAFGNMVGPYDAAWVLYLLDPLAGSKYTYVTNTTGGHMAVTDLTDKIRTLRMLRGRCHPVVRLGSVHMTTKYGGRERPSFVVMRWVRLDGNTALPVQEEQQALPAQSTEAESRFATCRKMLE